MQRGGGAGREGESERAHRSTSACVTPESMTAACAAGLGSTVARLAEAATSPRGTSAVNATMSELGKGHGCDSTYRNALASICRALCSCKVGYTLSSGGATTHASGGARARDTAWSGEDWGAKARREAHGDARLLEDFAATRLLQSFTHLGKARERREAAGVPAAVAAEQRPLPARGEHDDRRLNARVAPAHAKRCFTLLWFLMGAGTGGNGWLRVTVVARVDHRF